MEVLRTSYAFSKKAKTCRYFCIPYQASFPHIYWKYCPGSSQVRSPSHAKWPYLLKSLWCYSYYSFWVSIWNLQDIIRLPVPSKHISRDLRPRWPKVRPILWRPNCKVMWLPHYQSYQVIFHGHHTYNSFWDNDTVPEKCGILLNLNFEDICDLNIKLSEKKSPKYLLS